MIVHKFKVMRLILTSCLLSGCVSGGGGSSASHSRLSAQQLGTVAIISVNEAEHEVNIRVGNTKFSGMTSHAESAVQSALLRKSIKLAPRGEVQRLLKEIVFQRSGLTEGEAVQIGRMVNASHVAIVGLTSCEDNSSYSTFDSSASVQIRLINVQTGELVAAGTGSDLRKGVVGQVVERAAKQAVVDAGL